MVSHVLRHFYLPILGGVGGLYKLENLMPPVAGHFEYPRIRPLDSG